MKEKDKKDALLWGLLLLLILVIGFFGIRYSKELEQEKEYSTEESVDTTNMELRITEDSSTEQSSQEIEDDIFENEEVNE